MARLKVFTAPMGFHEAIVAAPSQKAALAAWGAGHNLFADGGAGVTEDPEVVAAALSKPGVVLGRPVGGGPIEDADAPSKALPNIPDLPAPKRAARRPSPPQPKPDPPAPKAPPDRSKLDAAEKALSDSEAAYRRNVAELDQREAELNAMRERLRHEHAAAAATLRKGVEAARLAFERASRG